MSVNGLEFVKVDPSGPASACAGVILLLGWALGLGV
ncbi:hypothetical protein CCACVL1_26120 [Corchorus capsularis]|uniref:Uncharacterized protein n=1 Tax=Corchorus capsularis TaxID=210143 RepID=A0A1R3GFW3_COCAP|nr:hypothetical protein CCACVL1_26120 [Corchorus capsularis]